jgi:hypothetical protein
LGVSNKEWGEQKLVAKRDTTLLWPSQENNFDLDLNSEWEVRWFVFFEQ